MRWQTGPRWRYPLVCLMCLAAWGCSSRLPHEGPAWEPAAAAKQALDAYDANGDGALDAEELKRSPGLGACLPRADTNFDGRLDENEILARISFYRDCRALRLPIVCRVRLDGKPLAGASMKLVPDAFLGSVIEPAGGTTDAEGEAALAVGGATEPGLYPGFYSVEITGGPGLPARYNTETTLGLEAAPDGGPQGLAPEFQLTGE